LFIATSASTPLQAETRDEKQVVLLTENDSNRNITFPYPEAIDVPNLYRSHQDYIRISNELVYAGVRFGNNNWTPVRARSFAEPVERLIDITSDQLNEIYRRGLYATGETTEIGQIVEEIEIQNLLARIDIPMARVEIRTDDGGHSLDLDVANLTFKELLLVQFYADRTYARAFRYDKEDIQRAHRNEVAAAMDGLDAKLEHPFTGKPILCREFLEETLNDLKPLAEALGMWNQLEPLSGMADGAPNTATVMREQIRSQIGDDWIVPTELLRDLASEREEMVAEDVERIANDLPGLGVVGEKLQELYWRARDDSRREPSAPIRFSASSDSILNAAYSDKSAEILDLAQHLIRIPTVSNVPLERQRLQALDRCSTLISDYLGNAGLEVTIYENGRYPAILAYFPGLLQSPIMLSGHFDVVEPEPDDSQFEPRIEGDYLIGRGAADMKTVVATYLVWMKDMAQRGFPYPGVNLLLVGNEEIGEAEPSGTPHVLADLEARHSYRPQLLIAGERTGEVGDEIYGEVCVQNRGLLRLEIIAMGKKGHTGIGAEVVEVSTALNEARQALEEICRESLTLEGNGNWLSQLKFPYTQFGERGIFNVAADQGLLGVEIRIIPDDSMDEVLSAIEDYCKSASLEINVTASEPGIICGEKNIYLQKLIDAIETVSGEEARLGKKLPGTSARFAPGGEGIVWGQSGIGPHSADERHYIPSIKPYYDVLCELGVSMSA
jgi:succinyl-diaminopimelate desuccinylase